MMAASALPTAHHEIVPPRIVSRPLVPRFVREEEPAEETQPLVFASQAAMPTIRFASETEVEEALGSAAAEPRAAAAPEPVANVPLQRTTYPVSSYYETARQQAWHEPAPRVEYAPYPDENFEPARQTAPEVAEEPRALVSPGTVAVPIPVVVEHIPDATAESRIEASRPVAEGHGAEVHGAVHGAPVAKSSASELIPVRASVFDDDFFRRSKEELAARTGDDAASKPWPDARVPSFAGYAGESTAENDELDIPAFLRRKQ
jgi:cell division protein FtsZ